MNNSILKTLFENHNSTFQETPKEPLEQEILNLINQGHKLRINYTQKFNSIDFFLQIIDHFDLEPLELIHSLIIYLQEDMSKEVFIKLFDYYSKHFSVERLFQIILEEDKLDYYLFLLEEKEIKKEIFNFISRKKPNLITTCFILDSDNYNYELLQFLISIKYYDFISILLFTNNFNKENIFNNKFKNNQILHENIFDEKLISLLLQFNFKPFLSKTTLKNRLMMPFVIEKYFFLKEMEWSNENIDEMILE